MDNTIRLVENKYYNDSYKKTINQNQGLLQNFRDLNFFYLYNRPFIKDEYDQIKIQINESISNFKWDRNFLDNIKKAKNQMINRFKESGFLVEKVELKLLWRLVIGLGASHPQETSMTLHHIFGIPYIPGSAIKGVTRHWAVLLFVDKNEQAISEIYKKQNFEDLVEFLDKSLEQGKDLNISVNNINFQNLIDIFGTQNQQGKVIFFDAFPVENINLKIDIMNSHYPNYYSGKEPPTDWQNPLPIKFLTVENTKFQFFLAIKKNGKEQTDYSETLLKKAKSLLEEALKNHGVGAKTALGYGIFQ